MRTADLDYVPAEVNISISAVGHSSNLVTDRCLVVTLIDDSVDERDEQFLVFISKVHVGSGVRIEEPLQSTITVVDNDGEKEYVYTLHTMHQVMNNEKVCPLHERTTADLFSTARVSLPLLHCTT